MGPPGLGGRGGPRQRFPGPRGMAPQLFTDDNIEEAEQEEEEEAYNEEEEHEEQIEEDYGEDYGGEEFPASYQPRGRGMVRGHPPTRMLRPRLGGDQGGGRMGFRPGMRGPRGVSPLLRPRGFDLQGARGDPRGMRPPQPGLRGLGPRGFRGPPPRGPRPLMAGEEEYYEEEEAEDTEEGIESYRLVDTCIMCIQVLFLKQLEWRCWLRSKVSFRSLGRKVVTKKSQDVINMANITIAGDL